MKEYEIGYMKPPKETQFKPGQTGNPKGRTVGRKNTYKILEDICNQKVQVTQNGQPVRISKREMMFLQATNKAIKGDIKAFQTLLPHLLIIDAKTEEREAIKTQMHSPTDREILDTYLKGGNDE